MKTNLLKTKKSPQKRFFKRIMLIVAGMVMAANIQTYAATWYYDTGNINVLTSWSANAGGGTPRPSAWTAGDVFLIAKNPTNAAAWNPGAVTVEILSGVTISTWNSLTIDGGTFIVRSGATITRTSDTYVAGANATWIVEAGATTVGLRPNSNSLTLTCNGTIEGLKSTAEAGTLLGTGIFNQNEGTSTRALTVTNTNPAVSTFLGAGGGTIIAGTNAMTLLPYYNNLTMVLSGSNRAITVPSSGTTIVGNFNINRTDGAYTFTGGVVRTEGNVTLTADLVVRDAASSTKNNFIFQGVNQTLTVTGAVTTTNSGYMFFTINSGTTVKLLSDVKLPVNSTFTNNGTLDCNGFLVYLNNVPQPQLCSATNPSCPTPTYTQPSTTAYSSVCKDATSPATLTLNGATALGNYTAIQWYQVSGSTSTPPANDAGATAVGTANSATFVIPTSATGNFKYYAKITNTCGGGNDPTTVRTNLSGEITVKANNTITAGTAAPATILQNVPLSNSITYNTTDATGVSITGGSLPAGLNGSWAGNVYTISGTPTASGTFNYTLTNTGTTCGTAATINGSITVTATSYSVTQVAGPFYITNAYNKESYWFGQTHPGKPTYAWPSDWHFQYLYDDNNASGGTGQLKTHIYSTEQSELNDNHKWVIEKLTITQGATVADYTYLFKNVQTGRYLYMNADRNCDAKLRTLQTTIVGATGVNQSSTYNRELSQYLHYSLDADGSGFSMPSNMTTGYSNIRSKRYNSSGLNDGHLMAECGSNCQGSGKDGNTYNIGYVDEGGDARYWIFTPLSAPKLVFTGNITVGGTPTTVNVKAGKTFSPQITVTNNGSDAQSAPYNVTFTFNGASTQVAAQTIPLPVSGTEVFTTTLTAPAANGTYTLSVAIGAGTPVTMNIVVYGGTVPTSIVCLTEDFSGITGNGSTNCPASGATNVTELKGYSTTGGGGGTQYCGGANPISGAYSFTMGLSTGDWPASGVGKWTGGTIDSKDANLILSRGGGYVQLPAVTDPDTLEFWACIPDGANGNPADNAGNQNRGFRVLVDDNPASEVYYYNNGSYVAMTKAASGNNTFSNNTNYNIRLEKQKWTKLSVPIKSAGSLPVIKIRTSPDDGNENCNILITDVKVICKSESTGGCDAQELPLEIFGVETKCDCITNECDGNSCAKENAIDGNSATRWSSNNCIDSDNDEGTDDWIYVDLGEKKTITKVELYWQEDAYGEKYALQVSNDAIVWNTVLFENNNSHNGIADPATYTFTNVTGRYVKMQGVKSSSTGKTETHHEYNPDDGKRYGYSLWEFNVYGKDCISCEDEIHTYKKDTWDAKASKHTEEAENLLTELISKKDSWFSGSFKINPTDAAETGQQVGDWIAVNMGAVRYVNQIIILHEAFYGDDYPVDYELYVPDAGFDWNDVTGGVGFNASTNPIDVASWTKLTEGPGEIMTVIDFPSEPLYVQYFKVRIKTARSSWWKIAHITVNYVGCDQNLACDPIPDDANVTATQTSICQLTSSEITLEPSISGVNYTLYCDNQMVTGSEKAGTDTEPVSWEINRAGTYSVKASGNGIKDYCTTSVPVIATVKVDTVACEFANFPVNESPATVCKDSKAFVGLETNMYANVHYPNTTGFNDDIKRRTSAAIAGDGTTTTCIEAEHFDEGGDNCAFSTTSIESCRFDGNTCPSGQTYWRWADNKMYRGTRNTVEREGSAGAYEYKLAWIRTGDWWNYTIEISTPGTYSVDIDGEVAGSSELNGAKISLSFKLYNVERGVLTTTTSQTVIQNSSVPIPPVMLTFPNKGTYVLQILSGGNDLNLNKYCFKRVTSYTAVDLSITDVNYALNGNLKIDKITIKNTGNIIAVPPFKVRFEIDGGCYTAEIPAGAGDINIGAEKEYTLTTPIVANLSAGDIYTLKTLVFGVPDLNCYNNTKEIEIAAPCAIHRYNPKILGWTASVKWNPCSGHNPQSGIDGDNSTQWNDCTVSGQNDANKVGNWFKVNMKQKLPINKIVLDYSYTDGGGGSWGDDYPRGYSIEVPESSNADPNSNNDDWRVVASGSFENFGTKAANTIERVIKLDSTVICQYFRIVYTVLDYNYWAIMELYVSGNCCDVDTIIWTNANGDGKWSNRENWFNPKTGTNLEGFTNLTEKLTVIIPNHGASSPTNRYVPSYLSPDTQTKPNQGVEIDANIAESEGLGDVKITHPQTVNYINKLIVEYGGATYINPLVSGGRRYNSAYVEFIVSDRNEWILVGPHVKPGGSPMTSTTFFRNYEPNVYIHRLKLDNGADYSTASWQNTFTELDVPLNETECFAIKLPDDYGPAHMTAQTYWYVNPILENNPLFQNRYAGYANLRASGDKPVTYTWDNSLLANTTATLELKNTGEGYAILCNTFLSNISVEKLLEQDEVSEVAVWVFEKNNHVANGSFDGFVGTDGSFKQSNELINNKDKYIKPMQAFMYKSTIGGTLDEKDICVVDNNISTRYNARKVEGRKPTLKVNAYIGAYGSEGYLIYNDELPSSAYDSSKDFKKLFTGSFYSHVPELYFELDGKLLHTQSFASLSNEINLGIRYGEETGTATLKFTGVDEFDAVYLEDKATGETYDLNTVDSVNVDITQGYNAYRFIIKFSGSGGGSITGEDESYTKDSNVKIYTEDNRHVTVSATDKITEIMVLSTNGQLLLSEKPKSATYATLDLGGYSGIYVVKAITETESASAKVVIK